MTVWVGKEQYTNTANDIDDEFSPHFRYPPLHKPSEWIKVAEKTLAPSERSYKTIPLDTPIIIRPGESRAIYIHSSRQDDQAIVYDNSRNFTSFQGSSGGTKPRYQDRVLAIYTGKAHVSTTPFGLTPIWGYWGDARADASWRDYREFVGQLEYGILYKLWSPEVHSSAFGSLVNFRSATETVLGCQRRGESPVARLPDECIYYVFNMCRWDWFGDDQTVDDVAQALGSVAVHGSCTEEATAYRRAGRFWPSRFLGR